MASLEEKISFEIWSIERPSTTYFWWRKLLSWRKGIHLNSMKSDISPVEETGSHKIRLARHFFPKQNQILLTR